MNRTYGDAVYSTSPVQDSQQGYTGLELYRVRQNKRKRMASILFWDASGQFSVETFKSDVPLDILEELIAEAKNAIKTG